MEILAPYFRNILSLFQIQMNVYGYYFSLWDVMIFTALALIILWFLNRVIF